MKQYTPCLMALIVAVFSVIWATSGIANEQQTEPPAHTETLLVKIGIRLIDVTEIDSREETFSVEGILYVDWKNAEEAENSGHWSGDVVDDRLKLMEEWPEPEFENGLEKRERSGMLLSVYEDGSIEYEERFAQTLSSDLDLRQFPFDHQNFPIKIIIGGGPEDAIKLEISEFSPGLVRLPEWRFSENSFTAKIETGVKPYGADFSPEFNRALFLISVDRQWGFYFWKIILPLLIITGVSWAVFWMNSDDLGSRLGVSFTALLTVVAFNFIVSDTLPRISYLTFLDALITLTYLWLSAIIAQSVVVFQLTAEEKTVKAQRINAIAKWLIPSSYLCACLGTVVIFQFLS